MFLNKYNKGKSLIFTQLCFRTDAAALRAYFVQWANIYLKKISQTSLSAGYKAASEGIFFLFPVESEDILSQQVTIIGYVNFGQQLLLRYYKAHNF